MDIDTLPKTFPCDLGQPISLFTYIYIFRGRDEVLMLKRPEHGKKLSGMLMAVGGKIEPGEDLAESARREVLEETGLEFPKDSIRTRGVEFFMYNSNTYYPTGFVFSFAANIEDAVGGELLTDVPEGTLSFYKIDDLPGKHKMIESNVHTIKQYRDNDDVLCMYKFGWEADGAQENFFTSETFMDARRLQKGQKA